MNSIPCDRNRIDHFFRSENSDADLELARHLDTCESCRHYFDSRAALPSQWLEATQMLQPCEFDQAGSAEFAAGAHGEYATRQSSMIKSVLSSLSPTDDPHRLGRLGGYEISGVVGVGGMGVVLKAFDPTLDRVVAIKVMAPHLASSGTARKRFSREAKAAAAVLHPNVIPIYCVSSDDAVPYLVMAYIRGGSLQKRLDREGPLPTVEILRIGSQIAAGLAAAHEQGLVHRDIKPENIMLDEGVERVTLTDFGLARAVDDASVTRDGTIAGTPQYMSPEQSRGESVDQQSDLFSLGSVLYTLCTGRPPYRADNSYGVMRRIIDEAPVPIRDLNPEIPEWLTAIVSRLMAKNKAERFATAAEVHKLLEACLSHAQQPQTVPLPEIPGLTSKVAPRTSSVFQSRIGIVGMSITASVAILAAVIMSQVNRPSLTVTGPELTAATATAGSDNNTASRPELIIESRKSEGAIQSGVAGNYSWKLKGDSVEKMTIRVLHIENGKTRVVSESIYQGGTAGEQRIEVELKLMDSLEPMPVAGKMLIPTLAVSVNGLLAKAEAGEKCYFPGDFQGCSESPRGPLGTEEVLGWFACNLKEDDLTDSLESIVDASKNGAAFLVTTVDWKGLDPASVDQNSVDVESLQGTWQVTSIESEGQSISEDYLDDFKYVFSGRELTQIVGKKRKLAKINLDALASPKTIDIDKEGETACGIYELQGDILRICVPDFSQPRPTQFDARNDRKLMTLRRVGTTKSKDYPLEHIKIRKTELNKEGQLEITFEPLIESMWYCPGANGVMGEEGLELSFPRVIYNKRIIVDYPGSTLKGSLDSTITVDPKNKPVFIISDEKRVRIWEPGDNAQIRQDSTLPNASEDRSSDAPQEFKNAAHKVEPDSDVDVRKLLEQAKAQKLSKELVIRIGACMGEPNDDAPEDATGLVEMWEFSWRGVHRVEYDYKDGKSVYHRLESRDWDFGEVCDDLLDGGALEICKRKGSGPETVLAGTPYGRGSRSIEVEFEGKTVLGLHETNGPFFAAYAESDAIAFGKLYERLAVQARGRSWVHGGHPSPESH